MADDPTGTTQGGHGCWESYRLPLEALLGPIALRAHPVSSFSCNNGGVITESGNLVDISTVAAATAGLWALAFAWWIYVQSFEQQSADEYKALKSIVKGLSIELELMGSWAGAGGSGYSQSMTRESAPKDWSEPFRLIWKFDVGAVSNLTRSPYLYRLDDIVGPFARLNFSVSRLFQYYDEYRAFANSDPSVFSAPHQWHIKVIWNFNFKIHVELIGGEDSPDVMCLYHTYKAATVALVKFEDNLKPRETPWWIYVGNVVGIMFVIAGGAFLLLEFFHH